MQGTRSAEAEVDRADRGLRCRQRGGGFGDSHRERGFRRRPFAFSRDKSKVLTGLKVRLHFAALAGIRFCVEHDRAVLARLVGVFSTAVLDGGSTSVEELELFAGSLAPDDEVALEATGPALAIARIIEPHVGRVTVANTRKLSAITESKVKTDEVDARTLCELLAAGFLPAVWAPDEFTRGLRRRLQRRSKLVRSRTRAKNECHAVLARNLKGRPPMTDVFGKGGRQWLGALELPADESETLECCLREVDFLDSEIGLIERELARQAMSCDEIRRLMTVPGVSLVSAAAFVAATGDIHRFSSPKKLVSYVGLDPRVRQSGEGPARHGRISKQGSSEARHMLCEAAWVADQNSRPVARVL